MGREILVDSRFRTSGTPEQYTFRVWSHSNDINSLRLKQAIIPKSIYPFVTSYNTKVHYDDGAAQSGDIAQGHYSGVELASRLQTLFTSTTAGITVTYDANTNMLVLANASGAVFEVTSTSMHDTTCQILGLDPTSDLSVGNGSSSSFPFVVDMSIPRYLLVDVNIRGNQSEQVWTEANSHTFMVPYGNTNFLDFENWTEANNYTQVDAATDVSFQEIDIKWLPPRADQNAYFSFNGAEHLLVFETDTKAPGELPR